MVEEKRGGEEKVGKVQNMVNMAGKWDGGGQRLQADRPGTLFRRASNILKPWESRLPEAEARDKCLNSLGADTFTSNNRCNTGATQVQYTIQVSPDPDHRPSTPWPISSTALDLFEIIVSREKKIADRLKSLIYVGCMREGLTVCRTVQMHIVE